jgi:hypothetical protein
MTEFEERLRRAAERGARRRTERMDQAKQAALDEAQLKSLHTRYRLEISEHIESVIRRVPDHLPGFRYEMIYGDRGWGAACSRDDLNFSGTGQRSTQYSRLEMTVRPYSELHVLELTAKGTIRNREVFHRNQFEMLPDADPREFKDLVDTWAVEFVEIYAAQQ